MTKGGYRQFCPVAMAAEILCTRWTVLVLRELIAGSTRFNDLRRGLPRISPALLSQRLKELETAKVISRTPSATEPGVPLWVSVLAMNPSWNGLTPSFAPAASPAPSAVRTKLAGSGAKRSRS